MCHASGTWACLARCNRHAQSEAQPWAAWRRSAASLGGQLRSRRASGTWACSARCGRNAPGAAQPWAARRRSAAHSGGSVGCVARAARGCALLAEIATRLVLPTFGPHCTYRKISFCGPALTCCYPMQTTIRVRAMEWSEATPNTSSIVSTSSCI